MKIALAIHVMHWLFFIREITVARHNLRAVSWITAGAYLLTSIIGCANSYPNWSEDNVVVRTVDAASPVNISPPQGIVVGRIQIVDEESTSPDLSSDLAIYILRDVAPPAPLPNWPVSELVRLKTRPFASDKAGYFRVALLPGQYYLQMVYRKKNFGIFAINPNIRFEIAPTTHIAYAGTLHLTINANRLNDLSKVGVAKDQVIDGAANLLVTNDAEADERLLIAGILGTDEFPDTKELFETDRGNDATVIVSEAILTPGQQALKAVQILLTPVALVLLLTSVILTGL
jgi:hypothetical protein